MTQSGETYTLKKGAYITVDYAVCEVKQECSTKYAHIDRIQIGTIDTQHLWKMFLLIPI